MRGGFARQTPPSSRSIEADFVDRTRELRLAFNDWYGSRSRFGIIPVAEVVEMQDFLGLTVSDIEAEDQPIAEAS